MVDHPWLHHHFLLIELIVQVSDGEHLLFAGEKILQIVLSLRHSAEARARGLRSARVVAVVRVEVQLVFSLRVVEAIRVLRSHPVMEIINIEVCITLRRLKRNIVHGDYGYVLSRGRMHVSLDWNLDVGRLGYFVALWSTFHRLME